MDQETLHCLRDTFSCLYNAVGQDAFGEDTPSREEFRNVMKDLLRTHAEQCDDCKAEVTHVNIFFKCSEEEQNKLIDEVGP
jgi:DNA-directed RNA polymerase subunit F